MDQDPPARLPAARLPVDTPFSYACHRCRACCHDKVIQVNPYEIARLARRRGCSTTEFIATFLDQGAYLRRGERGACVFLGPEGCTVHADRPLVCRLYPLGRHVGANGEVRYSPTTPHPDTKGVYGLDGTIADFLSHQGVAPFASAADRYLAVLQRLFEAWRAAAPEATESEPAGDRTPSAPPDLRDIDRALAHHCARLGIPEPRDVEDRTDLHLAIIAGWLDSAEAG